MRGSLWFFRRGRVTQRRIPEIFVIERTSILFEAETQAIWDVCKPGGQARGLEHTNGGLVTFAVGIPLRAPNGELLGAIGVSGGQVAQDFEVARAGAASLGA